MGSWNTWLVVLMLAIGLVLIVKGGDWFVDGASWLAKISGIPKLIIGATVVSVATTLPELLVSSIAAAKGNVDMAAGNAIGSVTANVALIMSLSILFMPAKIQRKDYYIKAALMLIPCVLIFACSFNGNATGYLLLWACIIMIVLFAANILENVYSAKKQMKLDKQVIEANSADQTAKKPEKVKPTGKEIAINTVKFILGSAGIVGGAELLVNSCTVLAGRMGISEQIIGLTIVAIGTSLPELVTTITAIIKKEHSLSVGNIIGANIIDMTLIMPICAIIKGGSLPVSPQTILLDVPFCFLVGSIALVPTLISGKFRRYQGVLMLALYVAYMTILFVGVGKLGIAV